MFEFFNSDLAAAIIHTRTLKLLYEGCKTDDECEAGEICMDSECRIGCR